MRYRKQKYKKFRVFTFVFKINVRMMNPRKMIHPGQLKKALFRLSSYIRTKAKVKINHHNYKNLLLTKLILTYDRFTNVDI